MATEQRLIDANVKDSPMDAEKFVRMSEITPFLKSLADDNTCPIHIAAEIDQIVELAPTVDAVEVVRCRDCKKWHPDIGWCDEHSCFIDSDGNFCHPHESSNWKMFDADYFCKDGERGDPHKD